MSNDFLEHKWRHAFKVFFDVNGSNGLDKDDFDELVATVKKHRGEDSAVYKIAQSTMEGIWKGLSKYDTDGDSKMSSDEWVGMWKEFLANGNSVDWQDAYIEYMFVLLDTTGDQTIDKAEYIDVMKMYNIAPEQSGKAFDQLKMPSIDKTAFKQLWREYFTSPEREKPGNYLFPGAL